MNYVAQTLNVDVTGMSMSLPELTVTRGAQHIRFVLESSRKRDMPVHLAAFFSKSVLSDVVFDYPRSMRVAVLTESPIDICYREINEVVKRFSVVFTHQRDLVARGGAFRPLMFGTNWLGICDDAATHRALQAHSSKTGNVSFIGSLEHPDEGPYRVRREIAQYVLSRGDVECYGKGIRPIAGKQEAIAPYRFSIAMENATTDDYFSEKLVDCLLMETVPVYYGCPGISKLFDPRGLITFSTRDELARILDELTPARYEQLRPFVLENKAKVVSERWHNHAGLFARLAEGLPDSITTAAPIRHGSGGKLARAWRRLGLPGT
jgi:hypothetical protein